MPKIKKIPRATAIVRTTGRVGGAVAVGVGRVVGEAHAIKKNISGTGSLVSQTPLIERLLNFTCASETDDPVPETLVVKISIRPHK